MPVVEWESVEPSDLVAVDKEQWLQTGKTITDLRRQLADAKAEAVWLRRFLRRWGAVQYEPNYTTAEPRWPVPGLGWSDELIDRKLKEATDETPTG